MILSKLNELSIVKQIIVDLKFHWYSIFQRMVKDAFLVKNNIPLLYNSYSYSYSKTLIVIENIEHKHE